MALLCSSRCSNPAAQIHYQYHGRRISPLITSIYSLHCHGAIPVISPFISDSLSPLFWDLALLLAVGISIAWWWPMANTPNQVPKSCSCYLSISPLRFFLSNVCRLGGRRRPAPSRCRAWRPWCPGQGQEDPCVQHNDSKVRRQPPQPDSECSYSCILKLSSSGQSTSRCESFFYKNFSPDSTIYVYICIKRENTSSCSDYS